MRKKDNLLKRRDFLKLVAQGTALSSLPFLIVQGRLPPVAACSAGRRPNVLFIFSDDHRYNAIHAIGNNIIQTPNIDALVENGVTFTHTHVEIPICTPSRAALLAGCSGFRNGVTFFGQTINPDLSILPVTMRNAGYTCFFTGKWHNDGRPYQRGFICGENIFKGGMSDHFKIPLFSFGKNDKHIGIGFSTELFTNAAVKFLNEHRDTKPFFMYVSFTAPHDPRTPPKRYKEMYESDKIPVPSNFMPRHPFDNGEMECRDERLAPWPRTPEIIREHISDYYGMISHLDENVGRIMAALKDNGYADNTLVIYAGDNGLAVGCHGLMGKQNMYDHSVRVPLIIAGPDIPKGFQSDALCYLYDLYPTICELTGIKVPDTVEAVSLVSIMEGSTRSVRNSIFSVYRSMHRMVRTDRWKLIRYYKNSDEELEKYKSRGTTPGTNKIQLFDIINDPDELNDLSEEPTRANRIAELKAELYKWQKSVGDKLVEG